MTAEVFGGIRRRAAARARRIVFTHAFEGVALAGVGVVLREKVAVPVLLGDAAALDRAARAPDVSIAGAHVVASDPETVERYLRPALARWGPAGVGEAEARRRLGRPRDLAVAVIASGDADGAVCGPAPDMRADSGSYVVADGDGGGRLVVDPTAPGEVSPLELARSALVGAAMFRRLFDAEPQIAFLSLRPTASLAARDRYRSAAERLQETVWSASQTVRARDPTLQVGGQPRTSWTHPDSRPNVVVLAGREAGDLAYRVGQAFPASRVLGPVAHGGGAPVNIVPAGASVDDIVDTTAVTALTAGLGDG